MSHPAHENRAEAAVAVEKLDDGALATLAGEAELAERDRKRAASLVAGLEDESRAARRRTGSSAGGIAETDIRQEVAAASERLTAPHLEAARKEHREAEHRRTAAVDALAGRGMPRKQWMAVGDMCYYLAPPSTDEAQPSVLDRIGGHDRSGRWRLYRAPARLLGRAGAAANYSPGSLYVRLDDASTGRSDMLIGTVLTTVMAAMFAAPASIVLGILIPHGALSFAISAAVAVGTLLSTWLVTGLFSDLCEALADRRNGITARVIEDARQDLCSPLLGTGGNR